MAIDNFYFKPESKEEVYMFLALAKEAGVYLEEGCEGTGRGNSVFRWNLYEYWGCIDGNTVTFDNIGHYTASTSASCVTYVVMVDLLSPKQNITIQDASAPQNNLIIKQVQELLNGMSDCEVKVEIMHHQVVVVAAGKRYLVEEDFDLEIILKCLSNLFEREV